MDVLREQRIRNGKVLQLVAIVISMTSFFDIRKIVDFQLLESLNNLPAGIIQQLLASLQEQGVHINDYVKLIVPQFNQRQFRENFRMSRTAFEALHLKLRGAEVFNTTGSGRPAVGAYKSILIAVWTLATPESYRSIAERFGVAKSTVFTCLKNVVGVLLSDVCVNVIKHPNTEAERAVQAADFERRSGIPKVLGAIDGSHIRIKAPRHNALIYFNRKKFPSLILQGVCDAQLFFTDVDVRWLGSVHDARVLRTSDLYPLGPIICSNGYYLLGDAAYPLRSWIMTPFKNRGNLNERQIFYNRKLSSVRQVIERAFALLKGRFRRLRELDMAHIENSVRTIIACCVMHNICLIHDEEIEYLIRDGIRDEPILNLIDEQEDDQIAVGEREHLVNYLWNNCH